MKSIASPNAARSARQPPAGMRIPAHGGGALMPPIAKGTSLNPSGKTGRWVEVQRFCREKSPDAAMKLAELLECRDERVELMAATKLLEWAWGAPQRHKPGDDTGRMVIDLKGLSGSDLGVLARILAAGAIRPAEDEDGVRIDGGG